MAISVLTGFVEVFIEVKRETHLSGASYFTKIIKELKEKLENHQSFNTFYELLWISLKTIGKNQKTIFGKAALENLNTQAALSSPAEMNLLLAAWFAELGHGLT